MEGIQVSVEKAGVNNNISVIKVGGYIDTTTSAEIEHSLDSLLKAGMFRIIIDLGNVDYISSAGWGIFISEIKGIREKGGDLKLVRMIPDVYEVFELLEFHYILKAFDNIEEAVNDFEHAGAIHDLPEKADDVKTSGELPSYMSEGNSQATTESKTRSSVTQSDNNPTVEEKIRSVIINNPDAGTLKLKRLLNSTTYGHFKMGYFALRRTLKKLHLGSKKQRIQFFRQRAAR